MPEDSAFLLNGKTAVVTGGLGQIGLVSALALANAGARTVVVDNSLDRWQALPDAQKSLLTFEVYDVSDSIQIPKIVSSLFNKYEFDVWVNAAYPRTGNWGVRPEQDTPQSWCRNVDMQMTSSCLAADHAAQAMSRAKKPGSIINMASIYGMVGPDFSIYDGTDMTMPAAYSAIKGGIVSHTRFLASYYGSQGIRVNVLCPGGIEAGQPASFVSAYSKRTALGRLAQVNEMGPPVVFMASEASSYITGAVIPIDGGWTAI